MRTKRCGYTLIGNERTMELTIDKLDEKTLALSNDTGKAEFTRKKK